MRLFINYASEDRADVHELAHILREHHHQPWLEEEEIIMGQNYLSRIVQAITYTQAFVYVISPAALNSAACREYYHLAQNLKKPIVVVTFTPSLSLAGHQVIDLSVETVGIAALLAKLDSLPIAPSAPAKVSPTAEAQNFAAAVESIPTLLNDLAEGPDGLGFRDYALAFAQVITSPHVRPPLTIGIYGEAGTGKTFLMHRVMQEIEQIDQLRTRRWWQRRKDKGEIRILQIDFDAWAYNTHEVLWAGLVQKIFKKIEDQLRFAERLVFTARRNVAKAGWLVVRRLAYFGILFGSIGLAMFLLAQQLDVDFFTSLLPILGLPFLLRLIQDLAFLFATPQSRQIATVIAGTSRVRSERRFLMNLFEEQRSTASMARIYEDMSKMLEALPPNTRLSVYIDDLDRCKPERVVEVLEAINMLLAFKEFIVFLAIDTRIVTQIIESTYAVELRGLGTGAEYLDKIVQVPFAIPKARSRDLLNYINKLLEAPPGEEDIWTYEPATNVSRIAFSTDSNPDYDLTAAVMQETGNADATVQANIADYGFREMIVGDDGEPRLYNEVNVAFNYAERCVFRAFSPYLDPNPRRIKRLINVYRLVRVLAQNRRQPFFQADPAKVILWLTLCQQWPHATAMMLDWIHDNRGQQPANLAQVYEHVAAVLDDPHSGQRHAELDYDNRALDRLMEKYGAYLTEEDIRRLQGLTLNFHPTLAREMREFID